MADIHAQFDRMTDAVEKLVRETKRLRHDVAALHQRIEPFEGETPIPEPDVKFRKMRTFVDVFDALDEASRGIRGSEYALTCIRGVMSGISSDAISRSEMKPWLKT
ncbi:hypothetical protein [Aurantimonas sp. A3-2-R12]|uniref:hypothetical protein n=1 Tax=Aurantimonas sp. A3-2-R12 TaxID=3114362 RepID=UPI002E19237A|nr:hypothetical protein [Aurantimonas sp. A3-2-R12]